MVSRLLIEYDGTGFSGWATQPGRRTVQEELERVLAIVSRGPRKLTVAGRTDAGVHAWGQVASYPGQPVNIHSLNGLLAPDVAVLACDAAPDAFSARYDARSRTYCYRVLTRRVRDPFTARTALHHPRPLDVGALQRCAAALSGTHDFTAFTPTDTRHRLFAREVMSAEWRVTAEGLEFWITAQTFMRNMNRILVGTMLEVGRGARDADQFIGLLEGAPRSAAGATAPARGLALAHVGY